MSASPFVTSHHTPTAGGYPAGSSIPARRPTKKFAPAPVHNPAPLSVVEGDLDDQLSRAVAVLALLRSVNRLA